ncbi:hypothetical protein M758_UG041300 [Ceratodon purpureus]|nr:hypothetical protein M758_UG041300 [Ceratodon purpureus]
MAEEPITVKSVMNSILYLITYPSQRRVHDLQAEFATMCKGKLKPYKKQRYFMCIHYDKDEFSNKMMLNRHRYVKGCVGAKHPVGTSALLVPYPSFRPREGKKVEVMGKTSAAKATKGGDGRGKKNTKTRPQVKEGKLMGVGCEGGKSKQAHGNGRGGLRIPPTSDLFRKRAAKRNTDMEGGAGVKKKGKIASMAAAPPFRSCR